MKFLRCSFTYWQSLSNVFNHKIKVGVIASSSGISDHKYRRMSTFIYQEHHKKSKCIRECFDAEHCTVDNCIPLCGKFTTPTRLSLLTSCKISVPTECFKMYSFPNFELKYLTEFLYNTSEIFGINILVPRKRCPLLSSDGACTFITIISHKWSPIIIHYILSVTNFNLLTADLIHLYMKAYSTWCLTFP